MRGAALSAVLLVAGVATARESPGLQGVGRISVQGGWRLTRNSTFYEGYYGRPENRGLERAPTSPGGPVVAATFGYSMTEVVELSLDVFVTGERLQLTGRPTLLTATYGAVAGLRLQWLVDALAPEGVVPFVGVLAGPIAALSTVEGGSGVREVASQMLMGSVGLNWRLSPQWGLTAEYRLSAARGLTPFDTGPRSFSAGGNWFTLGLTYSFPPDGGRPFPDY